MTNSAGLLFQYLSLISTYRVAWNRDRLYFQNYFKLSFSSKYKVANSQWVANLRDDHSSILVILLWCDCQCISYHLSLHHARCSCRPINLINFWAACRFASIGLNVEIEAWFFSVRQLFSVPMVTCDWSAHRVTDARTENSWTYLSHPPKHIIPNHPFTSLPLEKSSGWIKIPIPNSNNQWRGRTVHRAPRQDLQSDAPLQCLASCNLITLLSRQKGQVFSEL